MTTHAAPPWIGLAGPTASGKSAAALALATALGRPVEIVSVDSALVYRGMDIGTAKPSAAEQAAVPHHLIDLIEPSQAYSAAQFVADATRLIGEIRARGALPLLVGGTMLYFKALRDGLDTMPAADLDVRGELDAEAARRGWPALHAELAEVDPVTAARLAPNDAQRIQRALEVFRVSGRPLSHWQTRSAEGGARADDAGTDEAHSGDAATVPRGALIALEPASRAWLHERIAARFMAMLDAGLIDEVQGLRAGGSLRAGLPSMRCVGYRQVWEFLDGEIPRAQLAPRGIAATRQLAKRQLTWLRSMPDRIVVPADAPDAAAQVIAQVDALLREAPASDKSST